MASQPSVFGGLRGSKPLSPESEFKSPGTPFFKCVEGSFPTAMKAQPLCGSPTSTMSTSAPSPMAWSLPDPFDFTQQISEMSTSMEETFLDQPPSPVASGFDEPEKQVGSERMAYMYEKDIEESALAAPALEAESVESTKGITTYTNDEDGTLWQVTRGTKESPPQISTLEAQLDEVKVLFKQKFGYDVDDDEEEEDEAEDVDEELAVPKNTTYTNDEDGTLWQVTRGTKESPPQLSDLEAQLADVKVLFKQKYGYDVDDDEEEEDEEDDEEPAVPRHTTYTNDLDGTLWQVTRGTKELPPNISDLGAQLDEVKVLFNQKYGVDADDEEEEDVDEELAVPRHTTYTNDLDGTLWQVTRGTKESPPQISTLETQLDEVKVLFKKKYGYDVDDDEHEEEIDEEPADPKCQTYSCEADSTVWQVTRGTKGPPPQISALEAQLAEVKMLFKQKFGFDVDDEDDSEAEEDVDEERTCSEGSKI